MSIEEIESKKLVRVLSWIQELLKSLAIVESIDGLVPAFKVGSVNLLDFVGLQ